MNIKNLSSAALSAIAIALMSSAVSSCQRTELEPGVSGLKPIDSDMITLTIGDDTQSAKSVKSGMGSESKEMSPVLLYDDYGSHFAVQTQCTPNVSSINDRLTVTSGTKGQMLTTGNIKDYRDGNITVVTYTGKDFSKCWFEPTAIKFREMKSATVSRWEFVDSVYRWPSTDLRFFAWSPSDVFKDSVVNATEGTFTFNYTMPDPDPATNHDAEILPDILVSDMVLSVFDSDNGNDANLIFDHALAALRFEIGRNEGIKVRSVKLENILTQGKSTYTYNESGNSFAWSDVKTPKTYVQSFDEGWAVDPDYVYVPGSGRIAQPVGDTTATFMVIPQISGKTGKDPVKLYIELELAEDDVRTFQAVLSEGNATWKAGKVYTYIISINAYKELDIEIREGFADHNVKTDVKVENTGGRPSYVRVSIVANWVDGKGNIIRTCNWTETGTLEGKAWGAEGDKWILGEDGWFYYKYALKPGPFIYTDNLFDKYDPGLPQFPGTKLMMEIMAQGVDYDNHKSNVTETWGEAAAALLSTEFDKK